MEINKIEEAIIEIVEKKKKLSKLNYSDTQYDIIEEELHNLEDDFIERYGTYLENALETVHQEYCPEEEILLPIAYIGNTYEVVGKDESGRNLFDVNSDQGVFVEVEKLAGKNAKLVIVPGPLRMVLTTSHTKKIVWYAK